jgi:hypothetical protein
VLAQGLLDAGQLTLMEGDGRLGCPEHAPYDAIHVGAAAPSVQPAARLLPDYRVRRSFFSRLRQMPCNRAWPLSRDVPSAPSALPQRYRQRLWSN